MRQTQPLSEQPRRVIGRLAIEGHHRRWHTRQAAHLCAPAISHRRHFDVVRAPGNGLVKTMHNHVSGRPSANRSAGRHAATALPASVVVALEPSRAREERSALNSTRASSSIKRRGSRSPRPHRRDGSVHERITANIFFRSRFSTGFSRDVHRISTCGFERRAHARVDACASRARTAPNARCRRVAFVALESHCPARSGRRSSAGDSLRGVLPVRYVTSCAERLGIADQACPRARRRLVARDAAALAPSTGSGMRRGDETLTTRFATDYGAAGMADLKCSAGP